MFFRLAAVEFSIKSLSFFALALSYSSTMLLVWAGNGPLSAVERALALAMLPEPPRPVERVVLEVVGETGASRPASEWVWLRERVKIGASGSCDTARLMLPAPPRPVERCPSQAMSDMCWMGRRRVTYGNPGLARA